jgi:energy-converting hydrogenase Eha subunit E
MSGVIGEKGLDVLLQAMKQPLLYIGVAMIILGSVTNIAGKDIAVRESMWPVLVILGICLVVVGVTLLFLERKSPQKTLDISAIGLEILYPRVRELVPIPVTVTGTYKSWPDECELWLFSLRGGVYRPREKLIRGDPKDRTWSAEFSSHSAVPGQPMRMGVYAVGHAGQAQIQTYFRATAVIKRLHEHEPWPGMDILGPDIISCDEREVIIR